MPGGGKALTYLGLFVGAFALILQFALTVPAFLGQGRWLPDALIAFFSFYTILTNLALVLVYMSEVTALRWLGVFRLPVVRAMMVAVMVLVCGFYHILLSGLWAPEGLFRLADVTLHYVTPILYVVWWVMVSPHGGLHWRQVGLMQLPTLLYFFYILARGALINDYPYPVLEASTLGYQAVFLNALVIAAVLGVLNLLVIGADHLLARRTARSIPDRQT